MMPTTAALFDDASCRPRGEHQEATERDRCDPNGVIPIPSWQRRLVLLRRCTSSPAGPTSVP